MSHVFERTWSLYVLYKGIKNTYLGDPKEILDAMGEVKPTLMCSVPRLYQKAYHNILAKVRAGSNMKKKLFPNALNAGKHRANLLRQGRSVPLLLKWKYAFFDALIFKNIRKVFGLINSCIKFGADARRRKLQL